MKRIILASASARRRELLAALVADFDVQPSDVPEEMTGNATADALRLATVKARARATSDADALVVGSDTIVHDGRRSYGKPATPAEARDMLHSLEGRAHVVVTAVTVACGDNVLADASTTTVRMAPLATGAIEAYVASGRPMDKAGAYAIQDSDVPTVASIEGCYCAVMGLPLWLTRRLLESAGVDCREPSATFPRCATCPERTPSGGP
jgi:septum formation protein